MANRGARRPRTAPREYPCPNWVVEQIRLYFHDRCAVVVPDIRSSGLLGTVVDERRSEVRRQAELKKPTRVFYEVFAPAPDGQFVASVSSMWRANVAIIEHRRRRGSAAKKASEYSVRANRQSPDLVMQKLSARGRETRPAGESSILAWRTPGHILRVALAIGALHERHQDVLLAEFGLHFDDDGSWLSERRRAELVGVPQSTYRRRLEAALLLVKNCLNRGRAPAKK